MTNKIGCVQHDCDECKALRANLADAEAKLAVVTFANVESLDVVLMRLGGLRDKMTANTTPQPAPDVQAAPLETRIHQFDKAITRIARHVGACCGGVDTEDDNGLGSHTDQEIIRKIDAKVNAAVAAALEKAIEVCRYELTEIRNMPIPFNDVEKAIRAIPRDTSALDEYKAIMLSTRNYTVPRPASDRQVAIDAEIGVEPFFDAITITKQQASESADEKDSTVRDFRKVAAGGMVKEMVDRFIGWELPEDFSPDAGITFTPTDLQKSGVHGWPTGTNLFTADQADKMIGYVAAPLLAKLLMYVHEERFNTTTQPAPASAKPVKFVLSITLTGKEIKDIAEFAGLVITPHEYTDEYETKITIQRCPKEGIKNDDGVVEFFEYVAYLSEYPEEGCVPLGDPVEPTGYPPQPAPDVQAAVVHVPNAEYCPHCNPCRNGKLIDDTCRLNEQYNDVLRGLCSYLSAGGWNTTTFAAIDPQSADERIRWGIDNIVEVESARRAKAAVAAALEKASGIAYQWYIRKHQSLLSGDYGVCNERAHELVKEIKSIPRDTSALDGYKADRKDAERFRWLCEDHAGDERKRRNILLDRMAVMTYSAICTDIDAELKAKYNL